VYGTGHDASSLEIESQIIDQSQGLRLWLNIDLTVFTVTSSAARQRGEECGVAGDRGRVQRVWAWTRGNV